MSTKVRPGYKRTEVGVLPEEWEVGGLGGFWDVQDCKHVTARFVANGFPIASIREVQGQYVDLSEAKQTTPAFYRLLIEGGRTPRVGDLILSRNATVGEVAQVTERHPPFAMGQDVCLLRKRLPSFSTEYLQGVFRSSIIKDQFTDLMVGSTFKRVNVQQIRELTVPMPPPAEQEAIAEALSDADALIEALEQLIAKKRHLKQGAMQELLTGKRRLPGFEVLPGYKQTEVGDIPDDWLVSCLGDCGEVIMGQSPPGSSYNRTGIGSPLINGPTEFTDRYPIKIQWTTQPARFCKTGDLLICVRGSSTGRTNYANDSCAIGRGVAAIRAQCHNDTEYLSYQVISGVSDILAAATGSTFPSVDGASFRKIIVPLPTPAEQTAIATVLFDMDAEIAAVEAKLAKARRVKQGMMQELLTGRIRLI